MTPTRYSRRGFLGVAAAAAAAAGVLASCTGDDADDEVLPDGDGRVRVLNWSDYIDPSVVDEFVNRTGIDVDYDDGYDGNAEELAAIFEPTLFEGQPTGYDVIVPTYWLVDRLVTGGYVEPIPLEIVANHVNVDPAYLSMPWDRGARYHMPWQVGITGIAYNPALTGRPIGSVGDLFDPALRGRVGLVAEMRETVGLAMLLNGDDPSRATRDAAEDALDRLAIEVDSGQILRFTGDFVEALDSGEFAACLAWSGDIVQFQAERPDIAFVVPEEGGIRWFDSMIIPRYAQNPRAAAHWMDYTYEPEIAATITEYVQYISPIVGVREVLEARGGAAAQLAENPILFPDDDTRRRLSVWGGMDATDEDAVEARFNQVARL